MNQFRIAMTRNFVSSKKFYSYVQIQFIKYYNLVTFSIHGMSTGGIDYYHYKLTPDGRMSYLMEVGKSSAVRRYPIPQAAATPPRPIIDMMVRPRTADTWARSRTMTVTIPTIVIVLYPSKLSLLPNLEIRNMQGKYVEILHFLDYLTYTVAYYSSKMFYNKSQ